MEKVEFDLMMKKAAVRVTSHDKIDKKAGFAPPKDCDFFTHLRTVSAALECAIMLGDWDTAAEALFLARTLEKRVELAVDEKAQRN